MCWPRAVLFGNHPLRFGVALLDVLLELDLFDSPLPAATDLNGLEFAAADEGIGLSRADLQLFAYVREGEEPRHIPILPVVEGI